MIEEYFLLGDSAVISLFLFVFSISCGNLSYEVKKKVVKFLTSDGKLLEKRHKNHCVATRDTSNPKAPK